MAEKVKRPKSSKRTSDTSQNPNYTDHQLPGEVQATPESNIQTSANDTVIFVNEENSNNENIPEVPAASQSPDLNQRQQPEGDSEPDGDAVIKDLPIEPMADQTEINMPTENAEVNNEDTYGDANPSDYGIDYEPEEVKYEPPDDNNHDLPDLNNLLNSVAPTGENIQEEMQPDNVREAPSLFMIPEHLRNYQKIAGLRMELEEEEVEPYVEEFDDGAKEDILMIGQISLEEIQEEEKKLRDEHIAYREQEARKEHQKRQLIFKKTEDAKKMVAEKLKEKRKEIQIKKRLLQLREREVLDRIHKAFRRSEHQLLNVLEDRKGEVQTMYGDLMEVEGMYGGSKGRRWKVDWEKTPQPVQIKLKVLRGVKDKVPGGRYVMMVSLYNHLGGNLLKWSNLKAQRWGGTTLPLVHEGNFYNNELKVDHSVFTVLPSKPDIRPGMVIVFELFLLRGAAVSADKVMGWGAFPITDGGFEVIEGKYKCPMLYGEMDPDITKHSKIEQLIASDIDHWLCNIYFEIVKLPRYLGNQKEHEVELQFSSMLLNYPDRLNPGEEYRDGEIPVQGSLSDIKSIPQDSEMGSQISTRTEDLLESRVALHYRRLSSASQSISLPNSDTQSPPAYQSDPQFDDIEVGKLKRTKSFRPPVTHASSRYLIEKKKVKYGDESDSTDCEDEEDLYIKKKDRYAPVKGKPGMYYKRYKHNPVDEYHQQLFSLIPKTEVLKQAKPKGPQNYLEELEQHSFSVNNSQSDRGHEKDEGWEKVRYISRQFSAELGLSQWRSSGFWTIVFLFCFLFFVRFYLHYVAQWAYLQTISVPINKFDFYPYTVNLNYQPSLLSARQEVAVVMLGPMINIVFFAILVVLSWIMQMLMGYYPDIGSKFNIVYGLHAFLDPILLLIVDCALKRYEYLGGDKPIADFAKLYYNFEREQGSGLAGILITVFIYIFTMFMAASILYMYFLRLHNNGRMLDIFWRLHGDGDIFFLPYDLEMSNQELSWIIKKSEQWRGQEGERRKTTVYDYIWEEEEKNDEKEIEENKIKRRNTSDDKKEITTQVSIYTIHLDGLKELYRQFLRLTDGAIIEVFGNLTIPGMNKDIMKTMNGGESKTTQKTKDSMHDEVGEPSGLSDVGPVKRNKTPVSNDETEDK